MTKTPLIILAGFLGSGKTTLLRYIIQHTDRKIAVLMNEFGELGVDTETINKENIAVKELLEGCVCCSLQGEFRAAINEIIDLYHPELILVETTGIAEADNLVLDVDKSLRRVSLDAVVTIVDADGLIRFPSLQGNILLQIKAADLLLLNKVDLVSALVAKKLEQQLRAANPRAPIIATSYGKIDLALLFSVETVPRCTRSGSPHSIFETFSLPSPLISKQRFAQLLRKLPPSVYRMKGYVQCGKKQYLLNYVGGRFSFEEGQGTLKLVVIGERILREREFIKRLFSGQSKI